MRDVSFSRTDAYEEIRAPAEFQSSSVVMAFLFSLGCIVDGRIRTRGRSLEDHPTDDDPPLLGESVAQAESGPGFVICYRQIPYKRKRFRTTWSIHREPDVPSVASFLRIFDIRRDTCLILPNDLGGKLRRAERHASDKGKGGSWFLRRRQVDVHASS